MSLIRISPATITLWVIIGFFVAYPMLTKFPDRILDYDVFGYYSYLPQTFIYGDLELKELTELREVKETYGYQHSFYQFHQAETGKHVIQYTMGQALMNLPFFLLGHLFALLFGFSADGFSQPYIWSIICASYFYMVVGLIFLKKCLAHFFDGKTTAVILILVCLGTNYYQIHVSSHGMPHVYLFALYCILVWQTIRWHERITITNSIMLGLILGMLTLSRPTEIVSILIPLLYGVEGKATFLQKIRFLKEKRKLLLIVCLFAFLVGLPQLLYWKYTSGHFLFNSYRNPGEGLELFYPHTIDFLISFKCGWFLYTPMILIAIAGIFMMRGEIKKTWFIPVLVFLIVNIYISSCWSNWTYAGSFSQRTMVQSYVIVGISLGGFVASYLKRRRLWIFLLLFIVVILNVFQTWQTLNGIIIPNRMSAAYYFAVFGRTNIPDGAQELLLIDRKNPHFEMTNYTNVETTSIGVPNEEYFLTDEFSEAYRARHGDLVTSDHAWIVSSVEIRPETNAVLNDILLGHTVVHNERSYGNSYATLDSSNWQKEDWSRLSASYLVPEARIPSDEIRIYIWNRGQKLSYRNFVVNVYAPKQ